jgi:hypothetical protein
MERGMKKSVVMCSLFMAVFWGLCSVSNAATVQWSLAAPAEGDWTTGSNWDTGSPPGAADYVWINNGGTVLVNDGDAITVSRLYAGYSSGTNGTIKMSGGTISTGRLYMGYYSGEGTFIQTGGTITCNPLGVGTGEAASVGTYQLGSGASLSSNYASIGSVGTGTFTNNGGTHNIGGHAYVGSSAGTGTYNLNSGSITMTGEGTNAVYLRVGDGAASTGTFNMAGGTINTTATGVANLVVRNNATATGTFNGWGSVNLDGQLQNAGKVIANGYGTDRTMNMSSFSSVTNPINNTTDNGWYAQNGGKLLLPNINVSGDTTAYWGESGSVDLVNSVSLTFDSEASGSLTGSLLATDRSDVNTDGNIFIGVWDFSGPTFTSVDMAFHYDNALATALGIDVDDLQVFHYNGSSWDVLGGTVNAGSSTISVDGVDSFSQFAVGVVPEPTTLSLLVAGGLAILRRRKK